MADILKTQDVMYLCSLLVVLSGKAAEATSERDANSYSEPKGDDMDNRSRTKRKLSPETLELLCDEHSDLFESSGSTDEATGHIKPTTPGIHSSGECLGLHVEQERIVLSRFCDFLRELSAHGRTTAEASCFGQQRGWTSKAGTQVGIITGGFWNM